VKKGGHGKGNWGTEKKDGETEQKPAEEEVKREEPVEEEEVVEYEEVGVSLDDFLAQKKANSKGLLATAAGRTHEKANTKGTETGTDKKRTEGIQSTLKGDQVYAPTSEGTQYFGFSGKEDPVDTGRFGGRGDRERRERTDRPARGGKGTGGRKGGKLVIDDNDFPTL